MTLTLGSRELWIATILLFLGVAGFQQSRIHDLNKDVEKAKKIIEDDVEAFKKDTDSMDAVHAKLMLNDGLVSAQGTAINALTRNAPLSVQADALHRIVDCYHGRPAGDRRN